MEIREERSSSMFMRVRGIWFKPKTSQVHRAASDSKARRHQPPRRGGSCGFIGAKMKGAMCV